MPALYQRARPVRFGEVVGQEHVIEVLGTAVRVGRIGHAYLFSGPRGVGKTTTARLLAMAANCEAEDAAQRPCGECESCRLVQKGAHPDVTELDAASNNSVEDIRDLREKVGLAGLRGGMRVWILDEAHMLSRAAANALLKTLEEPPPGLLFILATTEPEKLPPTILSRCQHFRFRRLSDDEIAGKLTALCQAAGVDFEPDALRLVARVADGGMRDAESMLERLLVLEGGVSAEAAEEALGLPPHERLQAMAAALAGADLATLLSESDALYRAGFSPRTLAEQLGRTLRDALVGSVRGDGFRVPLEDVPLMHAIQALDDDMERFLRHNDLYALEVALIKALNAARGDVPAAREGITADAAGAMPATMPATMPASGPPAGRPAAGAGSSRKRGAARAAAETAAPADEDTPPDRQAAAPEPPAETAAAPAAAEAGSAAGSPAAEEGAARAPTAAGEAAAPRRPLAWREVKAKAGPQLKAFLKPAQESLEGDVMRLRYDEVHRFHHGQLLERADELAALVNEVAGPGYTVLVEGPEGGAPKKIA
ncbi:MAG TPA: DNA polymerase III subunit gamma/tau [Trueperaceae bacterium]|nr:DNA polymerase III subunit gamma/tau [Trueperaceae bacterium]